MRKHILTNQKKKDNDKYIERKKKDNNNDKYVERRHLDIDIWDLFANKFRYKVLDTAKEKTKSALRISGGFVFVGLQTFCQEDILSDVF